MLCILLFTHQTTCMALAVPLMLDFMNFVLSGKSCVRARKKDVQCFLVPFSQTGVWGVVLWP